MRVSRIGRVDSKLCDQVVRIQIRQRPLIQVAERGRRWCVIGRDRGDATAGRFYKILQPVMFAVIEDCDRARIGVQCGRCATKFSNYKRSSLRNPTVARVLTMQARFGTACMLLRGLHAGLE